VVDGQLPRPDAVNFVPADLALLAAASKEFLVLPAAQLVVAVPIALLVIREYARH
jgi:hypothetical protein